jgi:hypothetical protein
MVSQAPVPDAVQPVVTVHTVLTYNVTEVLALAT